MTFTALQFSVIGDEWCRNYCYVAQILFQCNAASVAHLCVLGEHMGQGYFNRIFFFLFNKHFKVLFCMTDPLLEGILGLPDSKCHLRTFFWSKWRTDVSSKLKVVKIVFLFFKWRSVAKSCWVPCQGLWEPGYVSLCPDEGTWWLRKWWWSGGGFRQFVHKNCHPSGRCSHRTLMCFAGITK